MCYKFLARGFIKASYRRPATCPPLPQKGGKETRKTSLLLSRNELLRQMFLHAVSCIGGLFLKQSLKSLKEADCFVFVF